MKITANNLSPSERGLRNLSSTIAILIAAPPLAVLIILFIFQSYQVFGISMADTLDDGDRLIVQKFSKNWAKLRGREYIPQRYEIVVFDKPEQARNASASVEHLIKRVIALPGERVTVRDGVITVYNRDNPSGFLVDEGQEYALGIEETEGEVDITLNTDEVFVVGDNRTNSLDSRSFGAVNTKYLIGVAKIRFVPFDSFQSF